MSRLLTLWRRHRKEGKSYPWVLVGSALLLLPAGAARGEQTRFFSLEGFGSWLDGNPETTVVTEDGAVVLGAKTKEWYSSPETSFSAATAWGDEVVVARVEDGRVSAINRNGKARELFKAEHLLVSAMVTVGKTLFVAAGPPARIYRVEATGKSELFHSPDAAYVWDMQAGPNNTLLLATGEPGTIVSLDMKGASTKIFEADQEHLRAVAYDSQLGVLVGGGERGILYRSKSLNKPAFRALYDSGHTEITAIIARGHHAYVTGVTGAQALAMEPGDDDSKNKSKGPEVRSQLVQVSMDGTAEVLAGSNDEAIFDLALDDKNVLVACTGATGRDDPRGRLYTVDPDKRLISMAYQSPSRRITHLVSLPNRALAAVAGSGGRVTQLAGGFAKKGEFLTTPFDAGINSQFGIIQIFGSWPKGTQATAAVRTGQTATPDETWSGWSPETEAPGNQRPKTENGRYMQIRLTLTGDGKQSPTVHRVRLAYRRQNLRPFVREVVALRKGIALLPIVREPSKSKTINLDSNPHMNAVGGSGDDKGGNARPQARQVERRGALTVRWIAEDPNGDKLRYDLRVRQQGRGDWRTVKERIEEPFVTLHSSQLADGYYQFQVRASDAPSNPDGMEQTDTRESRAVLIDNSPPKIDQLDVRINKRKVTIHAVVVDEVGPLLNATYAIDGKKPRPMLPDDGVLDGPGESFTIRVGQLPAGPHTLTIYVLDEGGNEGFGETLFQIN